MEWVPSAMAAGGPWALALGVIVTVTGLIFRGTLVPSSQVDRLVESYKTIIVSKTDEATAWKAAHALEVEASRVLREQNGKLLEHSALSAHAWDEIRRASEAQGRDAS